MKRRIYQSIFIALFIGTLSVLSTGIVRAQAPGDSVTLDQYKLLQKERQERAMLQRILAAMNIVDSAYIVHYPSWVVRDQDIRQRVYKTFRNRLKFPPRDSELVVITTPERDEIVRLSMGSVSLGREETRLYLGENLRRAILDQNYPHADLEASDEPIRPPTLEPDFSTVMFEGSLFEAGLHFANGWGALGRIGNEDMGYPFWQTGSVELMLAIDRLRIGAVVPLASGLYEAAIAGPITIQSRKLNGVPGFALEFQQPIGDGTFDLHVQSNNLTDRDTTYLFTDNVNFYYIRSMAQGSFERRVASIDDEHFFSLKVGVGFDQIGQATFDENGLQMVDKFNHVSPLVKISYDRIGAKTYGLSVQSYSSIAMLTAWIELVKNFIYLDVKYATPVFRDPYEWENSYFIMLSPRIRLAF